jgi:hypothetical protein
MTSDALTAIVQRALLNALQRHGKSQWGVVVEVPQTAARGDYVKVAGYFGITDICQDIAAAVEASLPKPCACPLGNKKGPHEAAL